MANNKISFSNDVIPIYSIDEKQRKTIKSFYSEIKKKIKNQIADLESMDKLSVSQELQLQRLYELKNSIQDNIREVNGKTQEQIIKNMTKVSNMTINQYNQWLNNMGIKIKGSFAHVSNDIINNILSGNLYRSDWTFSKAIWGDYNKCSGELGIIVAQGIAQNKSAFDIAKDLEKYVNPSAAKPWDWSKVYPGVRKKIDYNAQRLARTMVSHAYQQSLVEMSKHNPFVSGIEWRAAMVERTCAICEARNGQIYDVNKIPLDHPNGLCTYIAVLNKNINQISDEIANWVNGGENKNLDNYINYLGFSSDTVRNDSKK